MKRWVYGVAVGVVLLAVAALIGWGNAFIPPLTPSASEAWSRGRILGVMPVNVRVDVHATPDGGVSMSWVDLNDRLHVARLGTRGQVVSDRTPALGTDVPRDPQLLVGPGGETHLIWREAGEGRSLLTYTQLDSTASVEVSPFLFSLVGDQAHFPSMAFNLRSEIEVFWSGQAGIYHTTLSAAGETQGEPVLLIEDGERVSVQVDQAGVFHLAWLHHLGTNIEGVYYAAFDPERQGLGQPEEMARLILRPGQTVQSLDIGMDADTGYIVWVIQDMKNIVSSAQYAFFPLEIPRQKRVRDLELDTGGNPLSVWAVRGQYETLLVALTETIMTEDGPQLQIGVVTLHGEQAPGDQALSDFRLVDARFGDWGAGVSRVGIVRPIALYAPFHILRDAGHSPFAIRHSQFAPGDWPEQHLVTASEHPSLRPSMVIDVRGNLHLTWLESGGFGVYRVAYASTAAEIKEVYGRPTWWDIANRALELAMQFFLAVGLTPVLAIYWSLAPLGWLLLYLLLSGREHLTTLGTWVAFGVSILLEVASTYLIYPHRTRMSPVLQWSAPLATTAVALLVALLYLRRRDEKPLFGTFFVFAIVHGMLQVMCFVLVR